MSVRCFLQHDAARKLTGDWIALTREGTLTRELVDVLWKAHSPDRRLALLQLMIRFGLAAPQGHGRYLIPSLLKKRSESAALSLIGSPVGGAAVGDDHVECFLFFRVTMARDHGGPASAAAASASVGATLEGIGASGFLPSGMFSRFLAHCVRWSASTTTGFTPSLSGQDAVLVFGDTLFSLHEMPAANSIRVVVRSTNPLPVVERLQQLAIKVMDECYEYLTHSVLLPIPDPALPPSVVPAVTSASSPALSTPTRTVVAPTPSPPPAASSPTTVPDSDHLCHSHPKSHCQCHSTTVSSHHHHHHHHTLDLSRSGGPQHGDACGEG